MTLTNLFLPNFVGMGLLPIELLQNMKQFNKRVKWINKIYKILPISKIFAFKYSFLIKSYRTVRFLLILLKIYVISYREVRKDDNRKCKNIW